MTPALYFLAQSDWLAFVLVGTPFVLLAVWQLSKAIRKPGLASAPRIDSPSADLAGWHWAMLWFVLGTTLYAGVYSVCIMPEAGICLVAPTVRNTLIALGMFEVMAWGWVAGIILALLYLGRLVRHGVPHAVIFGFGVILLPLSGGAWTAFAIDDFGGEVTDYLGISGLLGYLTAIVLPDGVAKLAVWAVSCVALLALGSDLFGPVNPMWLLVVLAFGYGAYRIEWSTLLEKAKDRNNWLGGYETASSSGGSAPDDSRPPMLVRVAAFAIINLLLVAAVWQISRTVNAQDDAMPAPIMASVYIAIAVAGAGIMLLVMRVLDVRWIARDYAAATLTVGLVTASIMHIPATPAVGSWVWGETEWAQYWKPTLIAFACVGAAATVLTTLAGRLTQIRPLMVALVLPAAYLLPSEFLFDGDRGASMLDWLARFLEAAITMAGLWLMWYGFGPGRRNTAERMNVFPSVAA